MIISVMMMMMIIRISEGCSIAGCSGHGICDKEVLKCKCYDGFTGPDCATRSCAGGPAWVGFANGTNDVHSVIAECSNMGTCNEATGLCTCDSGFEGFACERMSCPKGTNNEECSGHGRCLTLEIMALTNDGNHLEYSTDYNDWDADRIKGCACDQGWEGYDCSERADCPLGDDPFTLGQVDEVQVLDCTLTAHTHTLYNIYLHTNNRYVYTCGWMYFRRHVYTWISRSHNSIHLFFVRRHGTQKRVDKFKKRRRHRSHNRN